MLVLNAEDVGKLPPRHRKMGLAEHTCTKASFFPWWSLWGGESFFAWIPRLAKTGTNPPSLPFYPNSEAQLGPHLLESGGARLYALHIIIEFIWGQWWGFSLIWIPFDFVSSSVEAYLLRYKWALHHYSRGCNHPVKYATDDMLSL